MMLRFKKTPETEAFAAAMQAEIRARTRRVNAQASFFELAGWSGVVGSTGLAIWLACLGVVRFNGENAKTQEAERAFIERVAATPLKVEVTAKLADGSQVVLASGAQVTLAKGGMVGVSPDSTVRLDPNATVRAVALAPDMRAAVFEPRPQAPDSTFRLDQSRIQPAAGLAGEASAKAAQGPPRLPVPEPRPQLRAISAALPASPRRSAQAPDAPRPAPKLLRQASAPAPKACQTAQP